MSKIKINKRLRRYGSAALGLGMALSIATPIAAYAAQITTEGGTITGYFKFDNVAYEQYIHNFNIGMDMTFLDGNVAYCTMFNFNNASNGQDYVPTGFPLGNNGLYTIINHGYNGSNNLGLANSQQAYMATQLAVWWYVAKVAKENGMQYVPVDASGTNRDYEFLTPQNTINVSGSTGQAIYNEAMRLYNLAVISPETDGATLTFDEPDYTMTKDGDHYITPVIKYNSNVGEPKLTLAGAPSGAQIVNQTSDSFQVEVPIENYSGSFQVHAIGTKPFYKMVYFKPQTNQGQQQWFFGTGKEVPGVSNAKAITTIHLQEAIPKKDSITVTKTNSSGQDLAGAVIGLFQNGKEITTQTTGSNGQVVFNGLQPGTYQVKELKAPSGYLVNDQSQTDILQGNGVNKTNTIVDKAAEGGIQVIKTGDGGKRLEGATFGLFQNGKLLEKQTTNGDGVATFPNLKYGSYQIKELTPPAGYEISKQTFDVNVDESGHLYTVTCNDSHSPGQIKVLKESETGKPLQGATFGLYQNGKQISTATTGSNGIAVFSGVPLGTYQIKEISAPTGYVLNSTPQTVTITSSNYTGVEDTFKDKEIHGSIQVTKTSKTGSDLAGATFGLYQNGKLIQSQTTGSDGKADFNNLVYGTYQVKEIKAPAGYDLSSRVINVDIDQNGKVYTYTVSDQHKPGQLVITKENESGTPLQGATFQLMQDGKVLQTVTTGADGKAVFNNLAEGTYQIKETKAPVGYVLNDKVYTYTINNSNYQDASEVIKDQQIKGDITIQKTNQNGQGLSGAEFELLNSSGKVIKTVTTEVGGLISIDNVPYGNYEVKEIKAPAGYNLNNSITKVDVTQNGKDYKVSVVDKQITTNITVTKENANGSEKLGGAVIGLYNQDGKLIEKGTTNKDGQITFSNVAYGHYTIREITPPVGYIKDSKDISVDITSQGQSCQYVMKDTTITSTVEVHKTSQDGKPLVGAIFGLYNSQGKEVYQATTNSDGNITITSVPYGKYTLKEIKAPQGFNLNTAVTNIDVTKEGQIITASVIDDMITGNVELLKTSNSTKKPLAGVEFELYKVEPVNGSVAEDNTPKPKQVDATKITSSNGTNNQDSIPTKVTVADGSKTTTAIATQGSGKEGKAGVTQTVSQQQDNSKTSTETKLVPVGSYKTDSSGILDLQGLSYGQYVLKETQPDKGYLPLGHDLPFQITKQNQVIDLSAVNDLIHGNVDIHKTNLEGNKELQGAQFEVDQVNAENLQVIKKIGDYTTNGQGNIAINNLPYGVYKITEIKAPDHYVIDSQPQYAYVTQEGKTVTLNVKDKLATGQLDITKENLTGSVLLPNTTFQICNANGQVVVSGITNNQGLAHFTLPEGSYTYQEIKAPVGYQINHTKYPFTIGKNGEIIKVVMKDAIISGKLIIHKISEDTGKPLAGATFTVYNSEGKEVAQQTTGENGEAVFNLDYGNYTYKETGAPKGYSLDKETYHFSITKQGEDISVNVDDESLPHTGMNPTMTVLPAFIVIVLGALFFALRKFTEPEDDLK